MKNILIILLFICSFAHSQTLCCAYTAPPSISYLLDTYTGASGAYSLRQLKSSATKAIRVREDAGNTESDIGFTSGDLDVTTLASFCGSNSCYVTKWYDQSGNSRDAYNTNLSDQPRIVNAGAIETQGGKPAIHFVTASYPWLTIPHSVSAVTITTFSVFSVFQYSGSTVAYGRVFSFDFSGGDYLIYVPILKSNTANAFESYVSGDKSSIAIPQNTISLFTNISTGSAINNYYNNTTNATSSYSLNTGATITNMTIGNGFAGIGNSGIDGYISEIIYWDTDQSSNRTGVETNINSFYSIY